MANRLQLGGYYLAPQTYDKSTGQWGFKPPVDYGVILHTNSDGVYPLLVMNQAELTEAASAFQEALRVYGYLAKHTEMPAPARYPINGTQYVSVTEVLKYVIAKPALLNWYAKMAKEGKDPNAVRDAKAVQGTTIHKNLLFFLQGKAVDLTQAPQELTDTMSKFAAWAQGVSLQAVALEQTIVHQTLNYAGTLDGILTCSEPWLLDWRQQREESRHGTT